MDNVQKAIEALRKTLEEFSGETFIYANQEGILDYPIGVVSRIYENPIGQPQVIYRGTTEITQQFLQVGTQIDYIYSVSLRNPAKGVFTSRNVIGQIQSGCYSDKWKRIFHRIRGEEGAKISFIRPHSLEGPIKIEGGDNVFTARLMIDFQVLNEHIEEDFHCVSKDEYFDKRGTPEDHVPTDLNLVEYVLQVENKDNRNALIKSFTFRANPIDKEDIRNSAIAVLDANSTYKDAVSYDFFVVRGDFELKLDLS